MHGQTNTHTFAPPILSNKRKKNQICEQLHIIPQIHITFKHSPILTPKHTLKLPYPHPNIDRAFYNSEKTNFSKKDAHTHTKNTHTFMIHNGETFIKTRIYSHLQISRQQHDTYAYPHMRLPKHTHILLPYTHLQLIRKLPHNHKVHIYMDAPLKPTPTSSITPPHTHKPN